MLDPASKNKLNLMCSGTTMTVYNKDLENVESNNGFELCGEPL